jgi:membrane protease YdiL (CAAX protease family)
VIWGAILLPIFGWAFTFGWSGGNFWVKIGISVLLVTLYSFCWQRPRISFHLRSLVWGILSAVILYIFFFLGNALAPYFLSGAPGQVGGIYSLGEGTSKVLVFLLLFFVTGPGEEIFWRGFLQEQMMLRHGGFKGYTFTTLIYAGVHIFSGNFILILAALIAGAFWGALYLWKRDLLIQIVSHSFWSAFIFAVFPVR